MRAASAIIAEEFKNDRNKKKVHMNNRLVFPDKFNDSLVPLSHHISKGLATLSVSDHHKRMLLLCDFLPSLKATLDPNGPVANVWNFPEDPSSKWAALAATVMENMHTALLNFILFDAGKAAVLEDSAFISMLHEVHANAGLLETPPAWRHLQHGTKR